MGNGTGKGLENLIDGVWPRVLSRGMSIIGWPLLMFVAWQFWETGADMVKSQREMSFDIRDIKKDVAGHEERIDEIERTNRRYRRTTIPREAMPPPE